MQPYVNTSPSQPSLIVKPEHVQLYEAIETFIVQRGFVPTAGEIGQLLGFTSSKAFRLIHQLSLLGSLEKRKGVRRGLTLVAHPREVTARQNHLSA